jgi:hypothetical protein
MQVSANDSLFFFFSVSLLHASLVFAAAANALAIAPRVNH